MPYAIDLQVFTMLTHAAGSCGSDLDGAIAALGLEITPNDAHYRRLPLGVVQRMLDALDSTASDGYFPFGFAEAFQFESASSAAAFVASSANLRGAARLLKWVPELIHDAVRVQRSPTLAPAWLCIHIDDPAQQRSNDPLMTELVMATIARMCRLIAPGAVPLTGVEFAHANRAALAQYTQFFGAPVRFGCRESRLLFDGARLNHSLPGHVPAAHAQSEQALLQHRVRQYAGHQRHEVERLLIRQPELIGAGMQSIASQLGIHPRTLQRQLRAEGTQWSDIVADRRHQEARRMLRDTDLDIASIATKLGYQERRSLTLAFRAREGIPPSRWRKLHTA